MTPRQLELLEQVRDALFNTAPYQHRSFRDVADELVGKLDEIKQIDIGEAFHRASRII